MTIAREDIQELMDADVDALLLTRVEPMTFNLKSGQFSKLKIHDLLGLHSAGDVVCLCDPEAQSPDRPHPQAIDISRFAKLDQEELERAMRFNTLIFRTAVVGGNFVISYKKQKVYEEPVYLLFECDDEPDEHLAESVFFEDRMGSIYAALQKVYGDLARLGSGAGYPAIQTQDIATWLDEQLENTFDDHRDNLLAALKLLLQAAGDTSALDDFIGMISAPVDDADAVVDALFPEHINFCDISAGYRTALWDGMVAVYQYFRPDMEYDALIERIQKRFEQDEFKEFRDYDIVITSAASTMIMLNHLWRDPAITCRRELAIAMLCFGITYGRF